MVGINPKYKKLENETDYEYGLRLISIKVEEKPDDLDWEDIVTLLHLDCHRDSLRNKEIYLSSAYYKYHWSWAKFKAFFKSMIKGESYMVVGFPYQLPVYEGYYPEEQIREEMQEDDFDSIAWSMEMDSLFFGSSEKAFYNFETVDKIRKIQRALYPKPYYALLNDSKYKYEPKRNGEIRLLSMDIATQGGSKNDATCFTLMQLLPTSSNQYIRNVLYITTLDGGHTFDQALKARRLFEDFDCDYIIVDTNGVGIGVFDNLVIEQVDDERNTVCRIYILMVRDL